ncbi:unnamed protein product, partial [Rotaria sp. Silwood2]
DTYNYRIMCCSVDSGNGRVIAEEDGRSNALGQLFDPNGLIFDRYEYWYASDYEKSSSLNV